MGQWQTWSFPDKVVTFGVSNPHGDDGIILSTHSKYVFLYMGPHKGLSCTPKCLCITSVIMLRSIEWVTVDLLSAIIGWTIFGTKFGVRLCCIVSVATYWSGIWYIFWRVWNHCLISRSRWNWSLLLLCCIITKILILSPWTIDWLRGLLLCCWFSF